MGGRVRWRQGRVAGWTRLVGHNRMVDLTVNVDIQREPPWHRGPWKPELQSWVVPADRKISYFWRNFSKELLDLGESGNSTE